MILQANRAMMLQGLVRTEGREADHICTEGGADIFIGNDSNRNGILEEDEVTSTTRLCHGKEGLSSSRKHFLRNTVV